MVGVGLVGWWVSVVVGEGGFQAVELGSDEGGVPSVDAASSSETEAMVVMVSVVVVVVPLPFVLTCIGLAA